MEKHDNVFLGIFIGIILSIPAFFFLNIFVSILLGLIIIIISGAIGDYFDKQNLLKQKLIYDF